MCHHAIVTLSAQSKSRCDSAATLCRILSWWTGISSEPGWPTTALLSSGQSQVAGRVAPALEKVVVDGLALSRRDASVTRALPVLLAAPPDLDTVKLRRLAGSKGRERTLGFFLDYGSLVRRLSSPERRCGTAASSSAAHDEVLHPAREPARARPRRGTDATGRPGLGLPDEHAHGLVRELVREVQGAAPRKCRRSSMRRGLSRSEISERWTSKGHFHNHFHNHLSETGLDGPTLPVTVSPRLCSFLRR